MDEKRILLSLIEEKIEKCDELQMVTSSKFLDMNEKSLVASMKQKPGVFRYFFGGFEEAERNIVMFLPEYTEVCDDESFHKWIKENEDENLVCLLKVEKDKFSKPLGHRDYLGALMGLGIKREIIGDIKVTDSGCEIACLKTMAEYIRENLTKAGRGTLKIEISDFSESVAEENSEGEETSFTVSSLRLDSVVKNAFSVSRENACEAIEKGLVFLNDIECLKIDKKINQNDKIVFRHKGRFIISDCSSLSKKGKVIVKGIKQ